MTDTNRHLRVFLCHSSADKPIVRELYQKLRAEKWIQPWLDEEELYPGQDWNLEIEKAIETTDVILVCLSKNSITKEGYVQKEIKIALDFSDYKPEGTVFIIPVRLEECKPPDRLSKWQYADFFEGQRERAFQRLLVSLKKRAISVRTVLAWASMNCQQLMSEASIEFQSIRNLILNKEYSDAIIRYQAILLYVDNERKLHKVMQDANALALSTVAYVAQFQLTYIYEILKDFQKASKARTMNAKERNLMGAKVFDISTDRQANLNDLDRQANVNDLLAVQDFLVAWEKAWFEGIQETDDPRVARALLEKIKEEISPRPRGLIETLLSVLPPKVEGDLLQNEPYKDLIATAEMHVRQLENKHK